jgi:oligopeptide/dipeptide ABC transporter ATP-binding protein
MPVLVAEGLSKSFALAPGRGRRDPAMVHAVRDIDLTLHAGEVLALVGESGSGKSTLASLLVGLTPPTRGRVQVMGQAAEGLSPAAWRAMRRRVQMVFQDPYESLNPTMTVAELVAEPLLIHDLGTGRSERLERVRQALAAAGLAPAEPFLPRRPHELSGGQRQRVAIAAALTLQPAVLVADEPVSMLDVSVRAEILNLLDRLRRERGIAVLYVLHDLGLARHVADRVAVMFGGRVVEAGPAAVVLASPLHPYTEALLAATPRLAPTALPRFTAATTEAPPPASGCPYQARCPWSRPGCGQAVPPWREPVPGHGVACVRPPA